MNRNLFKAVGKFPFYRTRHSHVPPPTDAQTSILVYAVKPLNDKGFRRKPGCGTFCYTSHALQGPEARISCQERTGLSNV